MRNKLELNSKNWKKDLSWFVKQLINKFYYDLNFEMDLSQWGIFIKNWDLKNWDIKNWDLKNRLSRKEILSWLFSGELSMNNFLLSFELNNEILNNLGKEKSLHVFLYVLLKEYILVEWPDESISKMLDDIKNKIFLYYNQARNNYEKKFYKEIIWDLNTYESWSEVNDAVDGILKPKKD